MRAPGNPFSLVGLGLLSFEAGVASGLIKTPPQASGELRSPPCPGPQDIVWQIV